MTSVPPYVVVVAAALLILSSPPSVAQQERVIVLEHADSLLGKILDGEEVRELVGRVRFRQGSVTVQSDRALQYLRSRRILLNGNVLVRDDTVTLKSNRGIYHHGDRIAEAHDGVTLVDGKTTLTAEYGRYYVDEKRAYFRTNVFVQDTTSQLRSNELTYFREDRRSVATGNVEIFDSGDDITISGGHFENFPKEKFSRMTVNPRVVQVDASDDRRDTFIVRSRVMESYRDSVPRLVAIDSVRMFSEELSAECGLAIFRTEADSVIMRKNPFVWYEENQVSGDSIFMKLLRRRPQTVFVHGRPMAISQSDSLYPNRFNQLTGELITMHFVDGEIQRIEVDQTATSVYFLYEDRRDSLGIIRNPNGANKTTGDRVVISFLEGKTDKISVMGGVEGEYFPENMVEGREQDFHLPGFNWRKDHPGRRSSEVGGESKTPANKNKRI
jgi:lipopolysaccharide export system protein LptA